MLETYCNDIVIFYLLPVLAGNLECWIFDFTHKYWKYTIKTLQI